MIVKYTRERGYKDDKKDPHLTIGKEYLVVSLNFLPYSSFEIALCSDSDGIPRLWDGKFFEIIDSRIPDGWSFFDLGHKYYRLEPQEFSGNFWDDFHDGNEEAENIFNKALKNICLFHGL